MKTLIILFDEALKLKPAGIKQRMVDNGMVLFPHTQRTDFENSRFIIESKGICNGTMESKA